MTQCCIITTGHSSVLRSAAMAERPVLDCFSRYIKKKKKQNEGEEEVGMREIITERRMCYPQGLLLIASLTRLWDVLVGYWMWIQLCRLRGVGILAQQTTAQFDINFSFFFFLTINFLLSTKSVFSPRGFPAPYQKWPSCDGLASSECQTALWYFNEAMELRKLPPAS